MSEDRLTRMKQKLAEYRDSQPKPVPQADPNDPYNPYHLPETNMSPRRMPTRNEVISSGGNYQQAIHTATVPNALYHNWPARLMDDLYEFFWKAHHNDGQHVDFGQSDLYGMLDKLKDHELARLLDALDGFPLANLTAVGADLYEGLLSLVERRRRPPAMAPAPPARIRVSANIVRDFPEDEQPQQAQQERHIDQGTGGTVPSSMRLK
jgi:hypothetical protein